MQKYFQKGANIDAETHQKSADPWSGLLEHLEWGRFPPPWAPTAVEGP
jgi:hypothetical protein